MRVGSLVVAALLAASPLAHAQTSGPLSVGIRRPFAFLLGTPTGEGGRTSSSEIIRTVSDLLREDTNLELELLDSSLMRACRGRLVCLTLKARRDYDREALLGPDGRPVPFREHVRAMRERGEGTILFTGGGLALQPYPDFASLAIGKAGIRSLTFSLAQEVADDGIHVGTVTICGFIRAGTKFDPDTIAESYWELHSEDRRSWSHERTIR